ncbi:MAG: hypothetical protein Q8K58_14190 [Acidimicrobiales bacterium]|nr:hypothetical protein [Acidimicrobiales bacterium]
MSGLLTEIDLKRHDKVRAHVDLPGVPAGTPGKVLVVSGVTWIRYRVLFDNGVEVGLLDGRHLVRPKEFVPVDQRVEVEAPVAVAGNGAAAEAVDDGAGAADNAFGVPAHLLERSKNARARLTGG